MRVPYPMGFFTKGMDGRIDDPRGGWKGKGIYATYAGSSSAHIEGGKGADAEGRPLPAPRQSAGEVSPAL